MDEQKVLEHLRKAAGFETQSEFIKMPSIPVTVVNPPQASSTKKSLNKIDNFPEDNNSNEPLDTNGAPNARVELPRTQIVGLLLDDVPSSQKAKAWISFGGIVRTILARTDYALTDSYRTVLTFKFFSTCYQ